MLMSLKKRNRIIIALIMLLLIIVTILLFEPIIVPFAERMLTFLMARGRDLQTGKDLNDVHFDAIYAIGANRHILFLIMLGLAVPMFGLLIFVAFYSLHQTLSKLRRKRYLNAIAEDWSAILRYAKDPSLTERFTTACNNIAYKTRGRHQQQLLEAFLLSTIARHLNLKQQDLTNHNDAPPTPQAEALHQAETQAQRIDQDRMMPQIQAARLLAEKMGMKDRCLQLLQTSSKEDTIAANCRKAGLLHCEEAIPTMLEKLDIPSHDIQYTTLQGFARMGAIDAIGKGFDKIVAQKLLTNHNVIQIFNDFTGDAIALHHSLLHYPNENVADLSLKSLDDTQVRKLIDDILPLLTDASVYLRIAATEVLGRLANAEYVPHLLPGFEDESWERKAATATAFAKMPVPEAKAPLVNLASAPMWWARQTAIDAILQYPDSEEMLLEVIAKQDRYANESIFFALERDHRTALLDKMRQQSLSAACIKTTSSR